MDSYLILEEHTFHVLLVLINRPDHLLASKVKALQPMMLEFVTICD